MCTNIELNTECERWVTLAKVTGVYSFLKGKVPGLSKNSTIPRRERTSFRGCPNRNIQVKAQNQWSGCGHWCGLANLTLGRCTRGTTKGSMCHVREVWGSDQVLWKSARTRSWLAEAWYRKRVALEGLNMYEEALMCYDNALALDPCFVVVGEEEGRQLQN